MISVSVMYKSFGILAIYSTIAFTVEAVYSGLVVLSKPFTLAFLLLPLGYGGAYFGMPGVRRNSGILRSLKKTLILIGFVILVIFQILVMNGVFKL